MSFVLYFLPFLVDFMMGGAAIAVSLFAIFLGASPLMLGVLGFFPGIVYISLCFLFGKLSETWPRKNLVGLGLFFYILSSLILCLSSRIYQLCLSTLLIGVGAAMFWPTMEAWVAEREEKRHLAHKMGLFNASWSIGMVLGPLAGGVLFGISRKLPFYFAFFAGWVGFFILLKAASENFPAKNTTPSSKPFYPEDSVPSFYLNISRVANFTLWFSLGIVRYIFPKLATNLGMPSYLLGLLMSTLFISQTLTFYGLGLASRWQYSIYALVLFQLFALFGIGIIFGSGSFFLFFLAFVLIGAGIGMTHSSSLFHSVNTIFQRGPRVAIHETVLGTGALLGPLMGGIVAQHLGLRAPYLMACAVIGAGIIIEIFIKKLHRQKKKNIKF